MENNEQNLPEEELTPVQEEVIVEPPQYDTKHPSTSNLWEESPNQKEPKKKAETEYTPYYYASDTSTFEMDFIIQKGKCIVPVEVKAEVSQQSRSLKAYCRKYQPEYAVRLSMKDYRQEQWLTNVPLYAAGTI